MRNRTRNAPNKVMRRPVFPALLVLQIGETSYSGGIGRTMEPENRFFRYVWRFNALALAAVLVVGGVTALIALIALIAELTRDRAVSGLVDQRPEVAASVREEVAALRPLGQTGLLWAPVSRKSEAALTYSSKGVSAVIDHVVYDPASGTTRFLYGQRPSLILSTRMLRPPSRDGEPKAADAALAVELVTRDGDGDGRLSRKDPVALALATPAGEALTIIATGQAVLGLQTISDDLAIATMRESAPTGTRTVALHLDLRTRSAIKKFPLPTRPGDTAAD